MKRFILSIISLLVMLSIFSVNVSAVSKSNVCNPETEVIYFEDGSYIITILEDTTVSRATNTKTGSKSINYYGSNDKLLWSATLKATFTYTGSTATCTSASITTSINDDNWKFTSATASKSGNKATGNITAKKYFLGIAIKTVNDSITLTCSATGTLS